MSAEPAGKGAFMSISVGDDVNWKTPQGATHGKARERRTKPFQFAKQKFNASEDEPSFIVESDKTGQKAAHKESALKKRT
jgi:surface antigen